MPPIPDNIPQADQELIRELLAQKPPEFTDLTLTQYEAFEDGALSDGNHLLVAETGNGKTFVAEAVTKKALQDGDKVAYLVPSVALVGEKHATLSAWAPESVTVNKGHGYLEADAIVATFESFFEAVVRGHADRFDSVILDDFHEIYSSHRGQNIEKGISAAVNSDMDILGISATVGNPHTVARWLDAELTISSEDRAVPIEERPIEKTDEKYAEQIARILQTHPDKGPFLVFNDTTRNAEARARGIADELTFDVNEDIDFREQIKAATKTELTETHETLIRLLNNGVAYHHSKLETGVKDLIEQLTEDGIIKCVFATTTLSYGFDSPVQSVIVADLKRNWEGQFIGIYEYVQWIGRAGREADTYDQAYAFVMYSDEEAPETFQFDISVEEKDIEDVTSHLSGQIALRWLVLELVNYGWETDTEVVEFIQSTLFWSENVQQVPDHIHNDLGKQPEDDVRAEIDTTLTWLTNQGLLHQPIGQPQTDETRYNATELGSALVEYEHSNWFDNSIESVLHLTEWLEQKHEDLTPETLIQRLGQEYYHCSETGLLVADDRKLANKMDLHNLSDSEGTTAALTCWFWCAGVSITDMEDVLDVDSLASLANTTSNISTALESIQLLYEPYEMPAKPEWLELLADQVSEGVPGPDMYLIQNVDYFGRALYNSLKDQLDRTGGPGSSWDPGAEQFVIERLSKLLADEQEGLFLETVKAASGIGDTIGQNLLESVREWDPEKEKRVEVPFAESARERPDGDSLTQYHEPTDRAGSTNTKNNGRSGEQDTQSTTLDDF